MKLLRTLAVFIFSLISKSVLAADVPLTLYDEYPVSFMYFYGITFSDPVGHFIKGKFHRWPEHVQSIEGSMTLAPNNVFRCFLNPLVPVLALTGNFTTRFDNNHHLIYEVNPYITFRWDNFPWNDVILTSMAAGEGISYTSATPSLEKQSNTNTKRILNYAMLEITASLPNYPRWQLLARLHHRSGAYGIYNAGNTGSNVIGLGIRYLF